MIDWLYKNLHMFHVEEKEGYWVAGFYDNTCSPSAASGDIGFEGRTAEEATKKLVTWVVQRAKAED